MVMAWDVLTEFPKVQNLQRCKHSWTAKGEELAVFLEFFPQFFNT